MSDAAVIVLDTGIGAVAGTMGFKYTPFGYGGRLYAAGYPGQVRRGGRVTATWEQVIVHVVV